ncbi:MAG: hypothetical protein K1X75_05905 [Leptospirales bacterium]|nr:hypothetical protein [Leptospirales bacterium]
MARLRPGRQQIAVLILALLCSALVYQRLSVATAIFGDGAGKWLQSRALLNGQIECRYDRSLDPEFKFLPGPWYYYTLRNGHCYYGYQYPYALAVALFTLLFGLPGYLFLNILCLLGYCLLLSIMAARLMPEMRFAALAAGAGGIVFIPALNFAFDLSEMTLAVTLGVASLALLLSALTPGNQAPPAGAQWRLAFGGLLIGLLLALRTESIAFLIAVCLALLVSRWISVASDISRREAASNIVGELLPSLAGFTLGAAAVAGFHLLYFGNILGNRGSSHGALILAMTMSERVAVARTLLLGGNLGLFSSMPAVLLSLLWLAPPIRRDLGRPGAFLFFLVWSLTAIIPLVAPNDAGYSWGPRYLAFSFAAYLLLLILIFSSLLRRSFRSWHRPALWLTATAIALYGAAFCRQGVAVLLSAARQNHEYQELIAQQAPEALLIDHELAMIGLSAQALDLPIYQPHNAAQLQALIAALSAQRGLQRLTYIVTPFRSPIYSGGALPEGWQAVGDRQAGGMRFILLLGKEPAAAAAPP